jgi:uncharacterized membrane protein
MGTVKATKKQRSTPHHHPHLHEVGGAAGGAIAGAAIGAIGGPGGAAAGAVIGGVIGAFVTKVADEESARVSFHDGELDAAIGVNGGDLGAPNLEHPPATRGTYSASSSGGGGGGGESSASGPMSAPED